MPPPRQDKVAERVYGYYKILGYDGTRAVRSIVKIFHLLEEVVNTGHSVPSAEKIRRVQNNRNGGNAMLIPPYILEFVVKRSRNMCAMTGLNIFPLNVWEEGVRRTGEEVVGCQSNVQHEIDCHPELVSGAHQILKHRGKSDAQKMLKQVQHDANFLKRTYSHIHLFTYSLHKKAAFTLAEVLITLGIIGVVAAMTMPSLIQNYQKKQTAVRLEKFYSIMSQAVLQWQNDEGIIVGDSMFTTEDIGNVEKFKDWFENGIGKYIKTIANKVEDEHHYKVAFTDGSGFSAYIGTQNTVYFFYCTKYKYCRRESYDGKRTFLFSLHRGKFITSEPGADSFTRDELIEKCRTGSGKGHRHYCTRLIQIDGWEIRKDYPWNQILTEDETN